MVRNGIGGSQFGNPVEAIAAGSEPWLVNQLSPVSNVDQPDIVLSDGTVASASSADLIEERRNTYHQWCQRVIQPRPIGHETKLTISSPVNWTSLRKPLSQCTVALVSTGGVHHENQEPFDILAESGDSTSRLVEGDVDTSELTVTHSHYATDDALEDINVMFPLDRLREFGRNGIVGSVSDVHFGFMGFIPDPGILVSESVPEIARVLVDHGVDVVVLTGS